MKIIVNTPRQMGEILLTARRSRSLTQAEAAARLRVGQPRLSALETTATASMSLEQLLALFALYGLELCVKSRASEGPASPAIDQAEW
jgi:HTH-type transcriptional regulator / antitoxin HipB